MSKFRCAACDVLKSQNEKAERTIKLEKGDAFNYYVCKDCRGFFDDMGFDYIVTAYAAIERVQK